MYYILIYSLFLVAIHYGFNSTSSSIKKLKTSYNGALRRLLLIKKNI